MLPFASRQLSPLLVRALVATLHLSLHAAFFLLGTAALLAFFGSVLWLFLRSAAPRFLFPALFGLLFWAEQFNTLVLPDILYGALLCLFLLLLRSRHILLAALLLFPLAIARESTILTLACFLLAGWRRLRLVEALTAVASMFAGAFVVKHLTANALPNNEHISPILYLFAKMPWTFLKNFLGINPWANVYRSCVVPTWQMPLHLGPLTAIGSCGYSPGPRQELLFYGLASFGLLPILLLRLRARQPHPPPDPRDSLFLRFAIVYGLVSFALAGFLGESFQRLFAYAWPLFLVALPILAGAARAAFTSNRAACIFLTLHLLLSWAVCGPFLPRLIPLELFVWIAGWFLLRYTLITEPEPPPQML